MKRIHLLIALAAILTSMQTVNAEVFATVGSRAMGMGGAFVAVANDGTAVYYNPAALFLEPTLQETVVGFVGEIDREEFGERANDFAEVSFQSPQVYNDPAEVARIAERLQKMAQDGGGVFGASGISLLGGKQVHGASLEQISFAHAWADIDLVHLSSGNSTENGLPYNTSRVVTTGLMARALTYTFSHSFFTEAFHAGLNVKYIQARTYWSETSLFSTAIPSTASNLIDSAFDENVEKDSAFTADIGILYLLTPRARFGVVGKYLTGPEFDTNGPKKKLRIDPQVRAGLSYIFGKYVTGDVDFDLTKNDAGPPGVTEREIAGGLEWWVGRNRDFAVRGGVSGNLAGDGFSPTLALGFGYRSLHFMADIAAEAINPDETKYSISFSFRL